MHRIPRRRFGRLVGGGALLALGGGYSAARGGAQSETPAGAGGNWAHTFDYTPRAFHEASSVEELQEIVGRAGRVKALGSRHSFSQAANTDGTLVSLKKLNQILDVDKEKRQVTVQAGITYGQLCPELHRHGLAVPNLASLPHISVAGAGATATHGSGIGNGNLATSIAGLKLVTAEGKLLTATRESHPEEFAGMPVNLGALGVVVEVTLDLVPQFQAQQFVYLDLPFSSLRGDGFQAVMSSGYSTSLFIEDWSSRRVNEVWIKHKVDGAPRKAESDFYGARPADRHVHPILRLDATSCTPQLGEVHPSYDILPHFKFGFTPSVGDELQAEFFVPLKDAPAALEAMAGIGDLIKPVLLVSEIRVVKNDDLWLSMAYGDAPWVGVHSTLKKDVVGVMKVLPEIERTLAPFGARFHWAKLTTMDKKAVEARYPKLPQFRRLAAKLDPSRKFENDYLRRLVLPT